MILPPRPIVEPEIGDLSALNSTTCDLIEVKLQGEFRKYWKWKPRQEPFVLTGSVHTATCLSAKLVW
jgi:hypothetical protein